MATADEYYVPTGALSKDLVTLEKLNKELVLVTQELEKYLLPVLTKNNEIIELRETVTKDVPFMDALHPRMSEIEFVTKQLKNLIRRLEI